MRSKILYVVCFQIIYKYTCFIKRNTSGLLFRLGSACLRCRLARNNFKGKLLSTYGLYKTRFILLLIFKMMLYCFMYIVFDSFVVQLSRFSFTSPFIEYVVLLIHSFSTIFKLNDVFCFVLWWSTRSITLFLGSYYFSSIHWAEINKILCFPSIYCICSISILYYFVLLFFGYV